MRMGTLAHVIMLAIVAIVVLVVLIALINIFLVNVLAPRQNAHYLEKTIFQENGVIEKLEYLENATIHL